MLDTYSKWFIGIVIGERIWIFAYQIYKEVLCKFSFEFETIDRNVKQLKYNNFGSQRITDMFTVLSFDFFFLELEWLRSSSFCLFSSVRSSWAAFRSRTTHCIISFIPCQSSLSRSCCCTQLSNWRYSKWSQENLSTSWTCTVAATACGKWLLKNL